MKNLLVAAAILAFTFLPAHAAETWITLKSPHSVADTADKLVAAVEGAGAKVFARVDHAAGAKAVGAELEPTVLVIFGNPKVGTPIIKADRRAGLELPIRVLIWEENGATTIGYDDPRNLKAKYSIDGADDSFAAMAGALKKLTEAAAQ